MHIAAMQSAMQGIENARQIVERAAESISSPDSDPGGPGFVQDIVDLKSGENLLKVNVAVLKRIMETEKSVIDVLA